MLDFKLVRTSCKFKPAARSRIFLMYGMSMPLYEQSFSKSFNHLTHYQSFVQSLEMIHNVLNIIKSNSKSNTAVAHVHASRMF